MELIQKKTTHECTKDTKLKSHVQGSDAENRRSAQSVSKGG